jgi:hypothetical protein
MLDTSTCGTGLNQANLNAYRIGVIATGDVICSGTAYEPAEPVPAGYVATAMLDAPACGTGVNQDGYNAYQISAI